MISRLSVRIILVSTLGLVTGTASAQPEAGATATAEQLFRGGKSLMAEGRIAEACVAFDGSYRKSPAISTLLNLADCREKNRQLATAWGLFLEAERTTRSDSSQAAFTQTARDRAKRLELRLSYLVINVPDESRVEGLAVTRNGTEVDRAEWNRKIPVDGGTYTVEGKAPAHEPWSARITVAAELDTQSVDVPHFKPATVAASPDDPAPSVEPASSWTGQRKAALAIGGVGVAAGVGALLFELSARSIYEDAKADPDPAQQIELTDQANQRRLYAQIAGGVAVAAVGTAAVLWITGKPSSAERSAGLKPLLGRDRVGLAVIGRF